MKIILLVLLLQSSVIGQEFDLTNFFPIIEDSDLNVFTKPKPIVKSEVIENKSGIPIEDSDINIFSKSAIKVVVPIVQPQKTINLDSQIQFYISQMNHEQKLNLHDWLHGGANEYGHWSFPGLIEIHIQEHMRQLNQQQKLNLYNLLKSGSFNNTQIFSSRYSPRLRFRR